MLHLLFCGAVLGGALLALQPTRALAEPEPEDTCVQSGGDCCKCWYTDAGDGTRIKHCKKDSSGAYSTCARDTNQYLCPVENTQQCVL